jgi:hypothetical protein
MRLPHADAHYSHRIRFGRYVERRLRTDKRIALADDVALSTTGVLTAGRSLEDTIGPVQEALADRDAADDALDAAAQLARLGLASRNLGADKTPPYTLIFPNGIGYYTAATLDQEESRYGELKSRLVEHLPANDSVRSSTCAAIDAGIVAFSAATNALATARTQESLAKTRIESAEEAWERQLTKVYGILVAEIGRSSAESFFPKTRTSKSKPEDGND